MAAYCYYGILLSKKSKAMSGHRSMTESLNFMLSENTHSKATSCVIHSYEFLGQCIETESRLVVTWAEDSREEIIFKGP